MGEDAWLGTAYGQALEYKIENAYNSSVTHGLLNGWDSGTACLSARAGGFLVDVMGGAIKSR